MTKFDFHFRNTAVAAAQKAGPEAGMWQFRGRVKKARQDSLTEETDVGWAERESGKEN